MWRNHVKNVCSISWLSGNYQQNCHSTRELFKVILISLIREYLLHVETEIFGIQSSSAALYHVWTVFCGMCELTEAVCDSKWSEPVPTQSECSFCGTDTCRALPPAPEVINMHLQPPWPSHSSIPRTPILALLCCLGTCSTSSILQRL